MAFEIDNSVPMPTPKPSAFATAFNEQGERELNEELPPQEPAIENSAEYAGSFAKALKQTARWDKRYYLVYFQPTPLGRKTFGWESYLLLPHLLNYVEATDLRDYIALEDEGVRKYAFVKLIEWKIEVGVEGMAGVNEEFDARNFEPEQWGGPHPIGQFDAYISDTKIEPNNSGTGGNLMVEFTTPAGSLKKYYAMWNQNQKTADGARRQLSALCYATGVFNVSMTNEGMALRNGKCKVDVGRQKPDDPDNTYVEIKKIYMPDGSLPGKAAGAAPMPNQNGGGFPQNNNPQQPPQQQPQQGFGNQQPQQQGGFNQQPQQQQPAPQQQPQQGGFPQQGQPQGGGFGQPQGQPQQQPGGFPQGGGAPNQGWNQDQGGGNQNGGTPQPSWA